MTDREKLIELIFSTPREIIIGRRTGKSFMEVTKIADHLIANGVRLEEKQATSQATSDESKRFAKDTNVPSKDVPDTNFGKWISVKDRLPEKDVKVLTFGVYGFSVNYRDRFSGKWRGVNGRSQWITHWMPLPQPPKGE